MTEKKKAFENRITESGIVNTLCEYRQRYSLAQMLDIIVPKRIYPHSIYRIGTYFTKMNEGGTEKVISMLIPLWLKAGYEVTLFTEEPEAENDYMISDEVERIVIGNDLYDDKERLRKLERVLKSKQIDIMVYHAWTSENLFWDMLLCKYCDVPFFVYTHGVFSSIYYYRSSDTPVMYKIYRTCDGIISTTEVSHKYYKQLGCNSYLVCNPCDRKLLEVPTALLNSKILLWVGRISTEKRPMEALLIFEEVIKKIPNARLVMLGDGNPVIMREMERFIERHGLKANVDLKGFVQDIQKEYLSASVLLVTSELEGFCLALLEGQAYGIPVVMYTLPYLPTVKNSGGIRDVEQGNYKDAAKEVIEIFQNETMKKKLGEEARIHAKRLLEMDIGRQWIEIFDDFEMGKVQVKTKCDWLELLIEHEEIGVQYERNLVKQELRYRIGDCVVRIPRAIKHWMKGRGRR